MDILLTFNSTEEVVKIIETGGGIAEFLDSETPQCPLIGSEIILVKPPLGRGSEGTVFRIKFRNSTENDFVVKEVIDPRTVDVLDIRNSDENLTFEEAISDALINLDLEYVQDVGDILKFNNMKLSDRNKTLGSLDIQVLYFPKYEIIFPRPCKALEPVIIRNIDSGVMSTLNEGSYSCAADIHEKIISSLVSYFFLSKEIFAPELCPHMVDIISFAHCDLNKSYTFMERIDGEVSNYLSEILQSPYTFDTFIFQVLVALSFLQSRRIAHQDLHLGNIFIKDSNREILRGANIGNYSLWSYNIDDKFYSLPNSGMMVKIGDWGFSGFYGETKQIIRKDVIEGDFPGYNIPTYFTLTYDISTFLASMSDTVSDLSRELNIDGRIFDRIKRIKEVIAGSETSFNNRLIDWNKGRPILSWLEDRVTCKDIIHRVFQDYVIGGGYQQPALSFLICPISP